MTRRVKAGTRTGCQRRMKMIAQGPMPRFMVPGPYVSRSLVPADLARRNRLLAGEGLLACWELGAIADCFLPDYGPPRAGDTTSDEEYALRDLMAEGVQLLEQAHLVRPTFGYGGNLAGYGWVTMRLGRSALASGSVRSTVEDSRRSRRAPAPA